MKTTTLLFAILTLSTSAFCADKCQSEVYKDFLEATEDYDFHTLDDVGTLHGAQVKSFKSFGKTVKLGYGFPVLSYQGTNEYMSGYGVLEIIVNPTTCKTLDMVEVYTE
jgi:hypothetical protein